MSTWDGVILHIAEITLKGGNRLPFMKRLEANVRSAFNDETVTVLRHHDRLVLRSKTLDTDTLLQRSAEVCGVAHAVPFKMLARDLDLLAREGIEVYRSYARPQATFAVKVKRADKQFPMSSRDVEFEVGGLIKNEVQADVDLTNPDIRLYYRIYEDAVYLEGPSHKGAGGLPMGVTGRVLNMFSGGIDSPVAAWLMMRRGCSVDHVHFHMMSQPDQLKETKIPKQIRQLHQRTGINTRLHLIPYHPFQFALLKQPVPQDLELILFRRYMMRCSSLLAESIHAKALVTGDNLAQVASQTMESLIAADEAATVPVFRPVLTMDKNEIIDIAREIRSFDLSIEDYQDCCSIAAKRPRTKPTLDAILEVERDMDIEGMTTAALEEKVTWKLPRDA